VSGHVLSPSCLSWAGWVTGWFYPDAVPYGSPRARPGSQAADQDALSISGLYHRIDRALKGALPGAVWVSGEVRSFNVSSRGICYIDLVDPVNAEDNATPVLKVVCWSGRWSRVRATLDRLGIALDAGLVVRVRGEVQLYKPRGDISFILSELDTDALLGKVAAERARLIKALVDENLYDRNRRVPVPRLPLRIGLVASPGTEGYGDFLGCLEASGMAFAVQVVPTHVQGRDAAASVASALERLKHEQCDILVLVRGGGSKADLSTFDAESVARAIATSDAPVWTGIGHTGDQSIADEVANRSFITPTECGQELARMAFDFWRIKMEAGLVAGRVAREQMARSERSIDRQRHRTVTGARSQLDRHADRLVHRTQTLRGAVRTQVETHGQQLVAKGSTLARSAVRSVGSLEETLSSSSHRLAVLPDRRLVAEDGRVAQWRRLLGAYDYQHQLERGYSVTRDQAGNVVRSAMDLGVGSVLFTRLSDGEVVSEVTDAGAGGSIDGLTAAPEDGQHDEGMQ
jgi:exodeoxyribonuclease VII large subunit